MAEQQAVGSAGEMMVFGLIEQADRIGKSALATQKDLAEQIEHLGEVQEWAVKAGVELQKQAAAAIKNLEGERTRLQGLGPTLQQNAAWAMRESLREHSDKIETQISAMDLTLTRQGELGTRDASHKPTASASAKFQLLLEEVVYCRLLGQLRQRVLHQSDVGIAPKTWVVP